MALFPVAHATGYNVSPSGLNLCQTPFRCAKWRTFAERKATILALANRRQTLVKPVAPERGSKDEATENGTDPTELASVDSGLCTTSHLETSTG